MGHGFYDLYIPFALLLKKGNVILRLQCCAKTLIFMKSSQEIGLRKFWTPLQKRERRILNYYTY